MADRTLIFHFEDVRGEGNRIGPTYFIEADYEPLKVRMYAERAPTDGDVEVDILVDGTTIFNNRKTVYQKSYGDSTTFHQIASTTAVLPKGEHYEEDAEDFKANALIAEGSWVHCVLKALNGAKNITVQMELERISEPDESE